MERRTEYISKRVIEINTAITEDLKLNQMNIANKSLESPALKTKWLMIYLEEKKYLDILKDRKAALIKEYVGSHGQLGVPKLKTQEEAEAADGIKSINADIKDQQYAVDYLEMLTKVVTGYNFDLKNAIDIIKIEAQ